MYFSLILFHQPSRSFHNWKKDLKIWKIHIMEAYRWRKFSLIISLITIPPWHLFFLFCTSNCFNIGSPGWAFLFCSPMIAISGIFSWLHFILWDMNSALAVTDLFLFLYSSVEFFGTFLFSVPGNSLWSSNYIPIRVYIIFYPGFPPFSTLAPPL